MPCPSARSPVQEDAITPKDKTDGEAKASADEIENEDKVEGGPRGDVDREDDHAPGYDAPPPLPG